MDRSEPSNSALLPPPADSVAAEAIASNFRKMSILFAINHGCVTSVLNLSVVLLGSKGSFMSGALFVTYATTALVAASAIVATLGSRKAIISGSFLYCVYILSFPLALVSTTPAAQAAVAIIGGGVGGVAAGFLWSAQGAYFALSAKLYSGLSATSVEDANAKFAAIFGVLFLGFEVVLKVVPLGLKAIEAASNAAYGEADAEDPSATGHLKTSDLIVAVIYSAFALGSAVGMVTIWDLEQRKHKLFARSSTSSEGGVDVVVVQQHDSLSTAADAGASATLPTASQPSSGAAAACESSSPSALPPASSSPTSPASSASSPAPSARISFERVAAAVLLWRKHPTVLLLAPVQITFGLCAALLGYQMSGKVVVRAFPQNTTTAAGCLSALVALVAAALQHPFKLASDRFGKPPVMLTGLAAFGAFGAVCLLLSEQALASYAPLVTCYMLHGIGRACFEGTNKALYADFFAADSEAAFSNIVLANGFASAVAYFTFPEMMRTTMASAALASAVVAVVAYLFAEATHPRQTER